MSEEQLKAFLEAVKADAGLQEKLKAAKDADAVVKIAKDAGFAVSAKELKKSQAEISEEKLECVAGGTGPVFPRDPADPYVPHDDETIWSWHRRLGERLGM